jgi:hypothetical protein
LPPVGWRGAARFELLRLGLLEDVSFAESPFRIGRRAVQSQGWVHVGVLALVEQRAGETVLRDDCCRAGSEEGTYEHGQLAVATTDALQLFLNEIATYRLLTAAEEVELAKRIEHGDRAARDRVSPP